MLQLIDRQTVESPTLKPGRLADPDLLREIAKQFDHCAEGGSDIRLVQLFSQVLHDFRIGGAWKRTNSGRLQRTEEMLSKHVEPHLRDGGILLDLGASDGVTTVELVRALNLAWHGPVFAYLTDLNLWLFRYYNGGLVEYRAADGEPIMVRVGRIGLRLASQRLEHKADTDVLARWYVKLRRLRQAMRLDKQISLVNPLAARHPAITVKELDCLTRNDELVGKFAAVRASNVLNLGYFSPEMIVRAVSHLNAYLREDGCLVISRNVDRGGSEIENGSVWRKNGERLVWIEDFGEGSEVKNIVEERLLRMRTPAASDELCMSGGT